jgi:hypothetical protein
MTDLAPVPLSVFTLTPHAHVYGKSFKAYSYRPGFTDTIPLIDIPRWDFYWQATYTLQRPLRLNTNRRCRAEVWYDNTVNNPDNPNNPPVDVTWGESTTSEMLYLFATVAVYQNGDENILLDSSLLNVSALEPLAPDALWVGPNPVRDILEIRLGTPMTGMIDLMLTDMEGRVQRQWRERDLQRARVSVQNLPSGVYVLSLLQNGTPLATKKIVKNE